MTRTVIRPALLALAVVLVTAPSAMAARGFSLGVAAGEVSATGAIVWGHADASGRYTLQVARDRRFRRVEDEFGVRAAAGKDNTVQRRVRGLGPGKRYFYRFTGSGGRRSDTGTFTTAPRAKADVRVDFAWTGDTDFNATPGQTQPYWNNGGVFRRMRAEGNDFNIHFGDTIYSDSEVPGRLDPIALTVEQKWEKYRVNIANPNLQALRRSAGFFSHWDDHEFINDFSPAESTFSNDVNIDGRELYSRSVKAFRDYAPVRWTSRDGLYRKLRWGRNLEVFFLDQRSFRSAKADEGGVCNNPQTGQPDLAPTAPPSTRAFYALLVPSLSEPVAQACLDAIRSDQRTYLGQRQLNRFVRDVRESNARFKVVMNELPIQQFYVDPYDRWEGYAAERQRLVTFLRDNVRNVVFLTADVHANLVNDVRLRTLEDGGPVDSGILEVTSGPSGTDTFKDDIEDDTNNSSAGDLANNFFLRQQPPNGPGIRCSNIDVFSYGQVTVTSGKLTIALKDASGRAVEDPDGKACGPYVVARR